MGHGIGQSLIAHPLLGPLLDIGFVIPRPGSLAQLLYCYKDYNVG